MTDFRLEPLTARQWIALPDPPASDMLLGPLVRHAARTIIVGDTGHGKTALAMQLARAILAGSETFGYEGAGVGPVLVIDLEQGVAKAVLASETTWSTSPARTDSRSASTRTPIRRT
jgi:RecA-family ATPase